MSAELRYLLPTAAGAFSAVAADDPTPLRQFLLHVIAAKGRVPVRDEDLLAWSTCSSLGEARAFLDELIAKGWLEVLTEPARIPEYSMDFALPKLLPALSQGSQVLLADGLGFVVFSHGFSPEGAEELAALSADLANLHARRGHFLRRNLGLNGGAWALINAAGHSQIGFWPLHIGDERLVLAIAGTPALNQPQLVDFVMLLHRRYVQGRGKSL